MYELPIQEQHGTVRENRYLKAKGTCQLNEATDGFRVQGIIACFISIVSLLMLTNQTYSEKGNGLSFPSFDLYCVCVHVAFDFSGAKIRRFDYVRPKRMNVVYF